VEDEGCPPAVVVARTRGRASWARPTLQVAQHRSRVLCQVKGLGIEVLESWWEVGDGVVQGFLLDGVVAEVIVVV